MPQEVGNNKEFVLKGSPSYYQRMGENVGPFTYLTVCLLAVDSKGRRLCTNACVFCSNWERGKIDAKREIISIEHLKNIIKAFKQLGGKRIVTMGDGEPLFGKNLDYLLEMAKVAGEESIGMTIFTNGCLLTESLLKKIDNSNKDVSFIININSLDKETYEKTTRVAGSFEKIMKNIEYWKERNKETIKNTDKGLITQCAITTVLSIANEKEIEEMRKFAENCNAAFICTAPMMAGSAEKNRALVAPQTKDLARFEKLSNKLSSTKGPTSRNLDGTCGYIAGYDSGKKHSSQPGGITIDLYGDARPCGYLLDGLPPNIRNKVSTVEEAKESLKEIQKAEDKTLTQIYKQFGFKPCLMRHEKLPEIEEFIRRMKQT